VCTCIEFVPAQQPCDTEDATVPEATKDLDILEDLRFERRWYRFEWICWTAIAVLLTAACLGLTGPGLVSKHRTQDDMGILFVEYSGLLRLRSPADIRIHVAESLTSPGELRLRLDGALAGSAPVERSRPIAASQQMVERGLRVTYSVNPGSPAEIVFSQRPEALGRLWSRISVEGGPSVELNQFTVP
jgi:hypothetical protein